MVGTAPEAPPCSGCGASRTVMDGAGLECIRALVGVMVKLPLLGKSKREVEAMRWAERAYPDGQPRCAARVAVVLADSLKCDSEKLSVNDSLQESSEFSELDHINLLLALEKEFGFSISDADGAALTTPGAIVSYVEIWADDDTVNSFEQGARMIASER